MISQTDANQQTTSISYTNQLLGTVDPFGRPGIVTDPQGRKAVTLYHDNARQLETKADLKTVGDGLLKTMTTHDQLGRAVKGESSEDGSTYTIATDTAYEQMGRITYTSNPHRSGAASTDGWTRTTNDDIGRIAEVATFDGATKPTAIATNWNGRVQTSYNAEKTTVTDQAGKQRKSVIDGLGRLVKVFEDPAGSNFETDYFYDALGNLLQVDQGNQHRYFTYDSLSRLKTARNAEQVNSSGTQIAAQYDYDDASNLLTRTNPNGTTVTFTYDGLNRVKKKTLSSGGVWNYTYDVGTNFKGRLVSAVLQGSTDGNYYDGYDAMGRVTSSRQITTAGPANSYSMSYEYDLASNLKRQVYPSGKAVITEFDNAGRIAGVKRDGGNYYAGDTPSNATTRLQYTAHGAIASMRLGNNLVEKTDFNSRLQESVGKIIALTWNQQLTLKLASVSR